MNDYSFLNKYIGKIVVVSSPFVKWKEEREKYLFDGNIRDEHFLREILDDEIVIEYDNVVREEGVKLVNETIANLDKDKYSYELFDHNGKSPHIHIKNVQKLAELDETIRKQYRLSFLKKYCTSDKYDKSLTGKHLVALEYKPHYKGEYRTIKNLIKQVNNGENKIDDSILNNAKRNLQKQYTANNNLSDDIIFQDLLQKYQTIPFPEGKRNDVISKNIAIGLIKFEYNSEDIQNIINKISITQKISVTSLEGWLKKVQRGEITDFNINEILTYCLVNNIDLLGLDEYSSDEKIIQLYDIKLGYQNLRKLAVNNYLKYNSLNLFIDDSFEIKGFITGTEYILTENIAMISVYTNEKDGLSHLVFFHEKPNKNWKLTHNKLIIRFYVYNLISKDYKYILYSLTPLNAEEYIIKGTLVSIKDKIKTGYVATTDTDKDIIFVNNASSTIKKLKDNNELLEIILKYKIIENSLMNWIFKSNEEAFENKSLRHPIHFERLIASWIFSCKYNGYPLHLLIIAKAGTGKTRLEECISWKMMESAGPLEGASSRFKALIPSFYGDRATAGYLMERTRVCIVDEFLRILAHVEKDNREVALGQLNTILEHTNREYGSGKGSFKGKMRAKALFVSNPVYLTSNMSDLCDKFDKAAISRFLIWYQDKKHIEYIRKGEGMEKNELNMDLNDWISICDYLRSFESKYNEQKITLIFDVFNKYIDSNVSIEVYSARYKHHLICLLDGIIKLRCICEKDMTFEAKEIDYDKLIETCKIMIENWTDISWKHYIPPTHIEFEDVKNILKKEHIELYEKIKENDGKLFFRQLESQEKEIEKIIQDLIWFKLITKDYIKHCYMIGNVKIEEEDDSQKNLNHKWENLVKND